MSQTIRAHSSLLARWAAICGLLISAPTAVAQNTRGGFGNFGLGTESGFGSLGSAGGTGGNTGIGGSGGGQATAAGLGGQSLAAPTLGGGGTLGSSFDAGFGATQMASSLATAAAISRVTGSSMGGRGGFGGGGFGGGGFGGGRGGRGGFGGNNMNQNTQNENKVRAVIRIGFPIERPASSYTSSRINQRLAAMPLPPSMTKVQISMDGRIAVLQGQVGSPEDVNLLERLLSLEPGIDGVRNELSLVGAVNQSEEVPAPAPQGASASRQLP